MAFCVTKKKKIGHVEVKGPIDGLVRVLPQRRAKRIKSTWRLGTKPPTALHLSHWFNGKYKVPVKQYDVRA
jgi:hypothetical protein